MSDIEVDDEFPGGPQQVEFWSLEIPRGKTVEAKLSDLPNLMEIAHVTGAALGEEAVPGRHVVKVIPLTLDGKRKPEVALGTLELGRTDQFSADFGFSSNMAFRHSGRSTVYLSGYMTRTYGGYGGMSDDEDDEEYEEEGEESSSSEEEDDEEAPQAVALQNGPAKIVPVKVGPLSKPAAAAAAAGRPAAPQQAGGSGSSSDDEDEEFGDSEDEDEDEDEDEKQGDEFDRRLGARSFGGGDPLDIDSDDLVANVQYADVEAMDADGAGASSSDEGESDEDESDDEDEDESDEDEGSSEEDEPQAAAAAAKQQQQQPGSKRGAQQALTPQARPAGKKQRGPDGKAVPASAPAKAPAGRTQAAAAAAGGPEGSYRAALVAELRKAGGNMSLSALGSKVKRPEGVSDKFKVFLGRHPDTFRVEGDAVKLAQQ